MRIESALLQSKNLKETWLTIGCDQTIFTSIPNFPSLSTNYVVAGAGLSIETTTYNNSAVLTPSVQTSIVRLEYNPSFGTFPVWVQSCVNLLANKP